MSFFADFPLPDYDLNSFTMLQILEAEGFEVSHYARMMIKVGVDEGGAEEEAPLIRIASLRSLGMKNWPICKIFGHEGQKHLKSQGFKRCKEIHGMCLRRFMTSQIHGEDIFMVMEPVESEWLRFVFMVASEMKGSSKTKPQPQQILMLKAFHVASNEKLPPDTLLAVCVEDPPPPE